jgi:hypothetical protein
MEAIDPRPVVGPLPDPAPTSSACRPPRPDSSGRYSQPRTVPGPSAASLAPGSESSESCVRGLFTTMHPPPLHPSHTPQDRPDCHLEAHCSGCCERVTVAGPPHAPPEPWARASARSGETVPVPGMRGESSARLLVCRPHPDVSGRPEARLGDRAGSTPAARRRRRHLGSSCCEFWAIYLPGWPNSRPAPHESGCVRIRHLAVAQEYRGHERSCRQG